jgi:formate hydrogenlyase subunit 7
MTNTWILRGIIHRKKTEKGYDNDRMVLPKGITSGLPYVKKQVPRENAIQLVSICPTQALAYENNKLNVYPERCIRCDRCVEDSLSPIVMTNDQSSVRWSNPENSVPLPHQFRRSIHIRIVDAGDCGGCYNEVRQLNNPFYNMHRFGFFITPTPRNADVLMVVGSGTRQMQYALQATYEAMPTPKKVIAVGTCALSGNMWSKSLTGGTGIKNIIPVDVEVMGSPPTPLTIIQSLFLITGRQMPANVMTSKTKPSDVKRD